MNLQGLPDFGQILKMAQQVASQIEPPSELRSGKMLTEAEMTSAISKITKSVSDVMKPEMLFNQDNSSNKKHGKTKTEKKLRESNISLNEEKDSVKETPRDSVRETPRDSVRETPRDSVKEHVKDSTKEKKKKRVVEIESGDSEEDDPIAPRTKDMTFTLSVTLEDLYKGTKKKLALRRQKIDSDGSYEDEKKKLLIKIDPGMIDEQTIRFNHMADEKQGFETGDVVITLDVEEHPEFVRDGNNLLLEKEISISEAYCPVVYIKHINGQNMKVTGDPFDIFGDDDSLLKKISGAGMPILDSPGKFGDLFVRFNCVNKTKITPEIVEVLRKIFPPLNEPPEDTDFIEKEFEMVTETDLEFFDSEDSDSESYETYSDEESSEEQ